MDKSPTNTSRELIWGALDRTGFGGLARMAIHSFIPSQHVQELLESRAERQKHREMLILHGAGEFELQVQKGLIEFSDAARTEFWLAVKSGTKGVKFSDVFDPHVANLLETTTPKLSMDSVQLTVPEITLE